MPALDALIASGGTRWSPSSPGPTRRPAAGAGSSPVPVAERAEEAGHRGAQAAPGRATRSSWTGCASSRPTAARSSPTARCCRAAALDIPRARLGQPALLAAARLARRRARAARGAAGDEVTGASTFLHRGGPGHRAGLRRAHRGRSGPPTPAATCSPGSPSPAPGCWSRPWTASRTARCTPCRSPPTASPSRRRSPSRTPGSTGPRPALRVDRLVRACTPGARRLDDASAASGSSSVRCARARRAPTWRPASSRPARTACTSAPDARGRLLAGPAAGQEADARPPTGRAACDRRRRDGWARERRARAAAT